MRPEIGHPVVVGGVKYRIRALVDGRAMLAETGPHWRTSPVVMRILTSALDYDRRAGLWRIP